MEPVPQDRCWQLPELSLLQGIKECIFIPWSSGVPFALLPPCPNTPTKMRQRSGGRSLGVGGTELTYFQCPHGGPVQSVLRSAGGEKSLAPVWELPDCEGDTLTCGQMGEGCRGWEDRVGR